MVSPFLWSPGEGRRNGHLQPSLRDEGRVLLIRACLFLNPSKLLTKPLSSRCTGHVSAKLTPDVSSYLSVVIWIQVWKWAHGTLFLKEISSVRRIDSWGEAMSWVQEAKHTVGCKCLFEFELSHIFIRGHPSKKIKHQKIMHFLYIQQCKSNYSLWGKGNKSGMQPKKKNILC